MAKTIITLEDDNVQVESISSEGISSIKPTNLESIQAILSADQKFETPLLPGQWGMQKYIRKDNREAFVLTVPETIREVSYDFRSNDVDEMRTYRIPTPASVWIMINEYNPADQSRNLRVVSAYALKNPILTENDPVFHMPFSNISGTVCWGSGSSIPTVTTAKSMQSVPTQFFLRPFNNDLGDDKFQAFRDDREGREEVRLFRVQHLFDWLDHKLRTEGDSFQFPNERLREAGRFGERLQRILREYGM